MDRDPGSLPETAAPQIVLGAIAVLLIVYGIGIAWLAVLLVRLLGGAQ